MSRPLRSALRGRRFLGRVKFNEDTTQVAHFNPRTPAASSVIVDADGDGSTDAAEDSEQSSDTDESSHYGRDLFVDHDERYTSSCTVCNIRLPFEKTSYAKLKPCGHLICDSCLSSSLARKLATEALVCQQCNGVVTSHIPHRLVLGEDGPSFTEVQEIQHTDPIPRDVYKNPCELKDPCRAWFLEDSAEQRIGKGLLYFAQTNKKKDGSPAFRATTCRIDLKNGCEDAKAESSLEYIWSRIHRAVYKVGEIQRQDDASLPAFVDAALRDEHLGTRLLYALSTGKVLTMKIRDAIKKGGSSYARSDYLAVFVANNMLMQSQVNQVQSDRKPSHLQQTIGDILDTLGTEKKIIRMLSELRISESLSSLERMNRKSVSKLLSERKPIHPLAFATKCYDNLVMTKKGRQAEKVQWTLLTIQVTSKERCKELGYYADNESHRISRVGRTLKSIQERSHPEPTSYRKELFLPRAGDISTLTFYELQQYDCVMKIHFPSITKCFQMDASGVYGTENDAMIPKTFGIDVHPRKLESFLNEDHTFNPFVPRKYDPDQPEPDDHETLSTNDDRNLLSMNDMFVDYPLQRDIASKDTVIAYFENFLRMDEAQLAELNLPADHERPVAEIMNAVVADGSPVSTAHAIFDKDAKKNNPKYDSIRTFPGQFHCKKENIAKKNALMEEVERYLIRGYRKTTGRQDFVLDPHDPNQFEDEVVPYAAAMRRAVVEILSSIKGRPVSPAEVHSFSLEEARKHPNAFNLLIDMRLTTIYFMLRDSERCNSTELFFSALRLLLPLLAVTNAPNYVRICVELLLWRATASPAEVLLFAETCFTRRTPDGKTMAVDKTQEKINGFFRDVVGHDVRPGHVQKMQQCAMQLDKFIETKLAMREVKGQQRNRSRGAFNDSKVSVDQVYVSVRLAIERMKVWDPECPTMVGEENSLPVQENILYSPSGKFMPSELLHFWSIGIRRLLEYIEVFYEKSRHSVSRPVSVAKGGVSVARINCLASDLTANSERQRRLATSLSEDELITLASRRKAPLEAELRRLSQVLLSPPNGIDFNKFPTSLRTLAEAIVKCRRVYIRQLQRDGRDVATALSGLALNGAEEHQDSYSDPDRRAEEVELDLYALCAVTIARFQTHIELMYTFADEEFY